MKSFVQYFNQLPSNPWAWLFIALITIGGFVLAYKSTPQKILKVVLSDNELITNKKTMLTNLDVIYNGKSVDKLTITKITFWNDSFPTINETDIIKKSPLTLFSKNGNILDVSVLFGDKMSNCINVSDVKNNSSNILFDYIDLHEGGVIQVIHTGGVGDIDVSRKLKGGKVVVQEVHALRKINRIKMALSIVSAVVMLFVSELLGWDLLSIFPKSWIAIKEVTTLKPQYTALLFIIEILLLVAVIQAIRAEIQGNIPRKLRKNMENYNN